MADKALTPREQRFVDEYCIDDNATRAAITAGYKDSSAHDVGYRLLKRNDIKNAIDLIKGQYSMSRLATRERIIEEVCRIAFFDVKTLYNDDGSLKKPHELESHISAAISSIEVIGQGGEGFLITTKKIKTNDKLKALDLLSKLLGIVIEKREISGTVDVPTLKVVLGG